MHPSLDIALERERITVSPLIERPNDVVVKTL